MNNFGLNFRYVATSVTTHLRLILRKGMLIQYGPEDAKKRIRFDFISGVIIFLLQEGRVKLGGG